MLSILGKLICNELGEQKYDMYFDCYSRFVKECSGEGKNIQEKEGPKLDS